MILNDVEKIGPCHSKYWQEINYRQLKQAVSCRVFYESYGVFCFRVEKFKEN